MSQDTFVFKQFTIQQDKCAMKVGTDAVILGAWVNTKEANQILDIGTGTAILSLMLAQKSTANIDALEIDKASFEQAVENVQFSKWVNQINVIHTSFQDYYSEQEKKYDLIISNPPYFIDSLKAKEDARTNARHNTLLPFEELIKGVVKMLNTKGKFCVILPINEAGILRDLAETNGLQISKLLRVRTKAGKENEKRHLMQFEFKPQTFSENTIVIEKENRHDYTDEYKELTGDFYLHF